MKNQLDTTPLSRGAVEAPPPPGPTYNCFEGPCEWPQVWH